MDNETVKPAPEIIDQPKTQADFDAAIAAGNYDFGGWHFVGDIRITGDHSGKDFNFYRAKVEGDLYASEATFNDLYASEATFRNLYASKATFNDLYASEATFRNLDASKATFNDLYASKATFNDLYASKAGIKNLDLSAASLATRVSASDYLRDHFEKTERGYIVYKTFSSSFAPNPNWKIEADSVIQEIVNPLVTVDCGAGINVAPLNWVKANCGRSGIWKCLIEWEWLADVIVPWHTDGKIRCGKLRLLEIVSE